MDEMLDLGGDEAKPQALANKLNNAMAIAQ
jgi:hypothetical protein